MTTLERVLDVATDTVALPDNVDKSTRIEDLQLDSLDLTELVMEFEEEFDITIEDDAVQKWDTFGDVVEYIDSELP